MAAAPPIRRKAKGIPNCQPVNWVYILITLEAHRRQEAVTGFLAGICRNFARFKFVGCSPHSFCRVHTLLFSMPGGPDFAGTTG